MPARKLVHVGLAAVVTAAALAALVALGVAVPSGPPTAAAVNCPQVQVVFARGRYEPPGPGVLGSAFIDALLAETLDRETVAARVREYFRKAGRG